MAGGMKSFKIKRSDKKNIPFELVFDELVLPPKDLEEGAVWKEKYEERAEQFEARPQIPGKMLLDIAAAMTGDGAEQAAAIKDFLTKVIIDEHKGRWSATLDDMNNVIDTEQISQIADWLMEQYGDRPTEPASA